MTDQRHPIPLTQVVEGIKSVETRGGTQLYVVVLEFAGRTPTFSSQETATSSRAAIDQAKRYAVACGWRGVCKKATATKL